VKLYEVNQLISSIFDQLVNPDTGEVIPDEALLAQLDSLQMERSRILEYLAKLVLNTKSEVASLREEEQRLRDRRGGLERKIDRLMAILDRECAGEKTNCGVATVCYRKTTKVDVADGPAAILWLKKTATTAVTSSLLRKSARPKSKSCCLPVRKFLGSAWCRICPVPCVKEVVPC